MARQGFRAAALLAAGLFWAWSGTAAAVEITTVAKTGDTAPGTGGATFFSFDDPVVNGAGEVAFVGLLTLGGDVTIDNDNGIWASGPGGLALVAREGDPAPGAGGPLFGLVRSPVVNGAGEVAFQGRLIGGGEGIWLGGPADLALVAKTGDVSPGTGGATFGSLDLPRLVLNGTGEVAFRGELTLGGDVTVGNDEGIWVAGPGGPALVARQGDQAPGAGGASFEEFFLLGLNGDGEVAFTAQLSSGGDGIWLSGPAGLALVAREGEPAPGASGATFTEIRLLPGLNGAGQVAFEGIVSSGVEGIWLGGPADLALVVKTGDPAPGAGGATFTNILRPVLNGAGEVTFRSDLSDGRRGVWVGRPASLTLVTRTGDPAPGAGGATFEAIFDTFLNGAGEVAFPGRLALAGGVTLANDRGIWAGGPGGLQLIAREGGTIEAAPGDFRTIADSGLVVNDDSGNEDGRQSSFSEGGQMAFVARFTDSSEGVFLAPPEAPKVHLLSRRVIDSSWDSFFLPQDFTKPVVIAGPPSFENKAPGVVRLRRVGATSFQAKFQEWKYLNGGHPEEHLDLIVMEKGRQKMADGSIWEAGKLKVSGNGDWKSKKFTKRFPGKPKVFLTVQGSRDRTPVAVRARNVTRRGFEAALFEEEKLFAGNHRKEKVGYLAVFSETNGGTVTGGVNGTAYALKRPRVKHKFKTVLGQEIKLEEEKSLDKERRHARERVAVMGLGRGHFAQQATDKEIDTTAIRRR